MLIERSLARCRDDDDLPVVQRRIRDLETYTKPLQDYYGYRQRLILVDANRPAAVVEQGILEQLTAKSIGC